MRQLKEIQKMQLRSGILSWTIQSCDLQASLE